MAINKADLDFAIYVLDQSIYLNKPMAVQDCALIKAFINALLEHQQRPAENVKSREWRAAVYRKLLEDPLALQQFTEQAIEKFGAENLARMVAPEIQEQIVASSFQDMSLTVLVGALKDAGRWTDILEYAMENNSEWVEEYFHIPERVEEAYDTGYAAGKDANEDSYQEGYDNGFNDGTQAAQENQ